MLYNENDLFFSYKNVFRFLLINQCFFLTNTNQLPIIANLFFIFKIYNLVDIDDVRSFNYAYLFRFFFGKKAAFTKSIFRFHLGVNYFSFNVYCFFKKENCFFPLSIYINDIISKSSFQFFFSGMSFNGFFFNC
jgi:hypothetical protein